MMDIAIASSLVNFAVVAFVLWKFGRQPLRSFLESRSDQIQASIREGEILHQEASAKWRSIEADWSNRESLVKRQLQEAESATKTQAEKTIISAKKEAERIKNDAQMMAASEVERTKLKLQCELIEKSVGMAANFFEVKLAEKERQKLVTEYIDLVSHGA